MFAFMKGMSVWLALKQVAFYFLFVLAIWGGKNKFGTKDFHDDYASLDTMKSLRGFAAIGVILHHISQEDIFQEMKVLSGFVNAGAYFVALFFFCSGYGLIKSLKTKENYLKGFVKKRIVKAIIIPFYVNVLIYALYLYISKAKMPAAHWIFNLSGLTMMNRYAWFPIVLTILYFTFFFCFRFIKKRPICYAVILLVIVGMGFAFSYNGHFAWWSGKKNWWLDWNHPDNTWWKQQQVLWFSGEWWVNSAIAFLIGLLFADFEGTLVPWFKKLYALKLHILLFLSLVAYKLSEYGQTKFGYWTEFSGKGPGVMNKFYTYLCQIPLFALIGLVAIVLLMKYHASNPVTRFFGKFSLHTYLMNRVAIFSLRFLQTNKTSPFKAGKYNLLVYAIGVFAVTVIFGVAEHYLTEGVKKLLFHKKKTKEALPS
ncbi:MAG: acyltransferase family protein [Clostridiales bacterium]|nr:acyltransferase family protein [Clostridiales bacterium]